MAVALAASVSGHSNEGSEAANEGSGELEVIDCQPRHYGMEWVLYQ